VVEIVFLGTVTLASLALLAAGRTLSGPRTKRSRGLHLCGSWLPDFGGTSANVVRLHPWNHSSDENSIEKHRTCHGFGRTSCARQTRLREASEHGT